MAEKSYYDILGVSKDATEADIKQAYKKLAKQYHPDLNPGNNEAAETFKKITAANDVLSDPAKRQQYDMEQQGFGGAGGFGGGMNSDIFGDIFSNFFGGFGGGGGAQKRSAATSVKMVVSVTFVEALKGVQKKLNVNKTVVCETCGGSGAKPGTSAQSCPKCKGQGRVQRYQQTMFGTQIITTECDECRGTGKIIPSPCSRCGGKGIVREQSVVDITIPRGVDDGQVYVMKGGGNADSTGEKGDLIIKVEIKPHKYIKRQGSDLYMDLPVPLNVALLGGKVMIPSPEGAFEYDIAAGTTNGKVIKIKNRGVVSKNFKGDLYVKVNIDMPKLSKKTKEVVKEFESLLTKDDFSQVVQFEKDLSDLM